MPNAACAETRYLENGLFIQGLLNALTSPALGADSESRIPVAWRATQTFVAHESDLDDGYGPGQHAVIDGDDLQLDVRLTLLPESTRERFRFGD